MLQELSETLITDHNQQRSRQVKQTREFLDMELTRLSEDVRIRETTLKEFLAKHPEAASINDDAHGRSGQRGAGAAAGPAAQPGPHAFAG